MGFSTEEITSELTLEGAVPLDYCFLLDDTICAWHPEEAGFVQYFIEDDDLYQACAEYIKANSDRCFASLDDVERYAEARHWDNLSALQTELNAWQRRLTE
jgi:hypothetical protein